MAKTRRASRSRKAAASRKQSGGKKRAASSWNKAVKKVFEEMRRKDRNASFGEALKEASRRKKAGNL
jgi:hypothetical protein